MPIRPVVLIIMDGWGCAPKSRGNAIARAKTAHITGLKRRFPHTLLGAAGEDVGLPAGQMGNSEVGHLNLGAGRIVYQDYSRLTRRLPGVTFVHIRLYKQHLHRPVTIAST